MNLKDKIKTAKISIENLDQIASVQKATREQHKVLEQNTLFLSSFIDELTKEESKKLEEKNPEPLALEP